MPKLKTKKTLIKRIKITSKGKLLRRKIRNGHLKIKWNSSLRHRKARTSEIGSTYTKNLKAMLPKV